MFIGAARRARLSGSIVALLCFSMEWIGYVGIGAFALAWIPQCWETARLGRCPVNLSFLLLAALGSFSLMTYAFLGKTPSSRSSTR